MTYTRDDATNMNQIIVSIAIAILGVGLLAEVVTIDALKDQLSEARKSIVSLQVRADDADKQIRELQRDLDQAAPRRPRIVEAAP